MSRLWTEGLGKPIRVVPNDAQGLDQLEKHISVAIDPMWGRDLRLVMFFGRGRGKKILMTNA